LVGEDAYWSAGTPTKALETVRRGCRPKLGGDTYIGTPTKACFDPRRVQIDCHLAAFVIKKPKDSVSAIHLSVSEAIKPTAAYLHIISALVVHTSAV